MRSTRGASSCRTRSRASGCTSRRRSLRTCKRSGTRARRRSPSASTRPLEDGLELGDGLVILGASRGALHLDELLEIEKAAAHPEHRDLEAMREELLVTPAANDLTEEVDRAEVGLEREVEAVRDSPFVPLERQARWRSARIRP